MPRLTRKIPALSPPQGPEPGRRHPRRQEPLSRALRLPREQGEYDRLVGEWLAADRHAPVTMVKGDIGLTVDDLMRAFTIRVG